MSASAQDMREQLKRWPLVMQPSNRGATFLQDARLVNCFAEKDPNTGLYSVEKRIGSVKSYTVTSPYTKGSGIYNFASSLVAGNEHVFSIFTNTGGSAASMFKDGSNFGSLGGLDAMPAGTPYSFVEDQAATPHLVFSSFNNVFWTTGSGGWTAASTSASGLVLGLAYLDQTIYLMDSTGTIWGSAFNDPTTWAGTNKIIANSIHGLPVKLTQQLNFVIALKTNSMEVFYDAENPSGSPLSPVLGALSDYGCCSYNSVRSIDGILFYASSSRSTAPQIVRVDNLQPTVISTPSVEKLLSYQAGLTSFSFRYGGHRYYGITVASPAITLVYDIDQSPPLWYQWSDPLGGFWPVTDVSFSLASPPTVQGFSDLLLQGYSDGTVYTGRSDNDPSYTTDNGVVFPVDIYTPNTDFGTRRRKTLHRMYIEADQASAGILNISRSDNDYKSFSVPRRVNLAGKTPYIDNEGTFIRRAYHFNHLAPTPFRIRAAALQMDIGTI